MKQKVRKFENFIETIAQKIGLAATQMYDLAKMREALDSEFYRNSFERFKLESECGRFIEAMRRLFGKEEQNSQ